MRTYFKKVLFNMKNRGKSASDGQEGSEEYEDVSPEEKEKVISESLDKNIEAFKTIFGGSSDMVFREFRFGRSVQTRSALIYIDGLTDKNAISQSIMQPLMYDSRLFPEDDEFKRSLDGIEASLLSYGDVSRSSETGKLVGSIASGDTVFIIDGFGTALIISTRKWENRGVQEPQTEVTVRGPREGFSESLRINTSLLRRKIKNPDLILENMTIGRRTQTEITIAYIKGIAPEHVLTELAKRLKNIDTDAILDSGYIEHFIDDAPYSIFSTCGNTEKPDVCAAKILEGRVAVFVDGSPFAVTVPFLFIESFQTSEDYSVGFIFASMLRLIRFFSYFLTVYTPAIYLSILTFHPEMIPTPLLFTLAASEEGLPLPLGIEMFLMLVIFEILREAGIRLPRAVGSAISIVGALVLGQAAVAAGVVSDFTVIVIGITAVSSFVVTSQTDSAAALRFICYVFAALLGGFGIVVSMLTLIIRLSTLSSFGVPYLSPLSPFVKEDMKDVFIRAPLWKMNFRPKSLDPKDKRRQGENQKSGANRNEV